MPRFKYSTWIILIAIFGLGWGASFAAGLAWSTRILPDEESAGPAQASSWTGGGASSGRPPAAAASRSQAAQTGGGAPSRQGAGASSASSSGARQASATGAGSAAGSSMGRSGSGRGVFGTVQTVAGDTLTVTGQSGSVKVKLSEKTAIEKRMAGSREATAGTRQDLKAGVRVAVQGPSGDDGTINAQTIQVLPAGRGGGSGRRGGG